MEKQSMKPFNLQQFVEMLLLITGSTVGVVVFCFSTFATKEDMKGEISLRQNFSDQQFREIKDDLRIINNKIDVIKHQ